MSDQLEFAEQFALAARDAFDDAGFDLTSAMPGISPSGDTLLWLRMEPSTAAIRDAVNPGHEVERQVIAEHELDETFDDINRITGLLDFDED